MRTLLPNFFSEWGVNQARDTYASYVGHYPMMSYFALAENESIARVKFNLTEVILNYIRGSLPLWMFRLAWIFYARGTDTDYRVRRRKN